MAILLKPDQKVREYTVQGLIRRDGIFNDYSVVRAPAGECCELRQYISPGYSSTWFAKYIEYLETIKSLINNVPELAEVFGRTTDIFVDEPSKSLCRITAPRPQRLADLMRTGGVSLQDRFQLAIKLAAAVAQAHAWDIVIVNIAPEYIGVCPDGSPIILGADRMHLPDCPTPWQDYELEVVVPEYAPPEVMQGDIATVASDVYSLGCVISNLLGWSLVGGQEATNKIDGDASACFIDGLPGFDRARVSEALLACHDPSVTRRPRAEELLAALTQCESANLQPVPRWLSEPVQALAFWVAYQREIYRFHPLPEGAIVAEFTRLLNGAVTDNEYVQCEVALSALWPDVTPGPRDGRADIAVIARQGKDGPVAVVEVKRGLASREDVDADLRRLAHYRAAKPTTRMFLLIVSQGGLLRRWVIRNGTARLDGEMVEYEGGVRECRVRIVKKASASFKSVGAASYCCLIEVL